MTKCTYSKWIEHDGKGMPVDGDVLVSVRFRDGDSDFEGWPIVAGFWDDEESSNWVETLDDPEDDGATISAYRIATPIKEPLYTSVDAMVRNPDDWEDEDD